MSKKVLTGAMAAVMATGMVTPVMAETNETKSLAELHVAAFEAYNTAMKAAADKEDNATVQKLINEARKASAAFLAAYEKETGSNEHGDIPTWSTGLDSIQHPILAAIVDSIVAMDKNPETITQEKLNEVYSLLWNNLEDDSDNLAEEYLTGAEHGLSQASDTVQQKFNEKVVAAVEAAKTEKTTEAVEAAKALVEELSTALNPQLVEAAKVLGEEVAKVAEEIATPVVESVSVINAKELQIKFNKSVKEETIISKATITEEEKEVEYYKLINASITAIGNATNLDGKLSADLSEDGKTLTVTAPTKFDGQYAVTVTPDVKTTEDKSLEAYTGIVTANDKTRPVVSSVTYTDYATAVINFSEPLAVTGTITSDNSSINSFVLSKDKKSITVDLSDSNVKVDKEYNITIIGAKDFNGNLITPNPVTVKVKKSSEDKVKPTVVKVESTSEKTFNVTFSEKLINDPKITVDNYTVKSIEKDESGLVYSVTLNEDVSTGDAKLATVKVIDYTDLAGNKGKEFSKIVEFKKDTVVPEVVSYSVEKIDGKEYLVLNYNENITPQKVDITGKVVVNFVESDVKIKKEDINLTLYNDINGKSKSVKLDLAGLESGEYTLLLPVGLVKDLSGNDSKAKTVKFTRTTNLDTGKPQLVKEDDNGIVKDITNNDTYTVHFDRKLDPSTALNVNNYVIEGAVVKSAIFTQNDENGAVVRLTLEENSVTLTGERTVTIKNVTSAAGVAMDTVVTTEKLTENVRAKVKSAKITAVNEIEVKFSENVKDADINDFDVVVDDTKLAVGSISFNEDTMKIILKEDLTTSDYNKVITLKATSSLDITDTVGNALDFTSIVISK